MAVKQSVAVVLAVMLLLTAGMPIVAVAKDTADSAPPLLENNLPPGEDTELPEQTVPQFSIRLVEEGDAPGLYGTLSHIPENAMSVGVEYSFDGESYNFVEDDGWALDELSPGNSALTQLCMRLDEHPYTAFTSGAVNGLYIRLVITCDDSDDIQTEPVLFSNDKIYPVPETPPHFTAALVYSWDGWWLYGALSEMTEDMTNVVPCYSMDGEDYIPEEYNAWTLGSDDPDLLRQQCFGQTESPLKEYLAGEIDRFYVKLQITYEGGSTLLTEAVPFERAEPVPLPAEYQVQAWYAAPIRIISYKPLSIRGQYHFTVPDTATPEELKALLPQTVPVELQIYRDGNPTQHEAVVDYAVLWQELPPPSANTEVLAASVTPPEACTVIIGSAVYQVKPPEILPENGPELRAAFHMVTTGVASEVLLSVDGNTEADGIRATFSLKPTGAVRVVPEYSLDGETGWTALDDVLGSAPLEEAPPRFKSHTFRILSSDTPPLAAYLSGEIAGFYVRLSVEGGALTGTTQAAAWPADYDYVPPRDDSDDNGSGGNGGNIGSDNSSGNSGSNGGQRPNLPGDNEVEPIPTPAPTPEPEPTPEQVPEPTPEPTPEQVPVPTAEPTPVPEPEQPTSPRPKPTSTPTQPVIAPIATPTPEPSTSIPPAPSAKPEPSEPKPVEPSAAPVSPEAEEQLPQRQSTIPVVAVVFALTAGGGIAVCGGLAAASAGGTGGFSGLIGKIKRLFSK